MPVGVFLGPTQPGQMSKQFFIALAGTEACRVMEVRLARDHVRLGTAGGQADVETCRAAIVRLGLAVVERGRRPARHAVNGTVGQCPAFR
ncbi:MAG: hypothetical protein U5L08_13515 [Xanthomonadales bacterium]|nr:hypothetical protein [Xanthomonadales bacterium]